MIIAGKSKETTMDWREQEKFRNISFDDCRKVGVVNGMTEGQIYVFGEERAEIFPCWMLIVHVGKYQFLWPVLSTYYKELATAHIGRRWDYVSKWCWHYLLIDEEKLPFACGKTYKFQLPFGSLCEYIESIAGKPVEAIEQNIRKEYEKYAIELLPDHFGNIEDCRLLLSNSSDVPQLLAGKSLYIANTDYEQDLSNCAGFSKWEYVSSYNWHLSNVGTAVHIVPTIAIEVDSNSDVKGRWLGQEILAEWKHFCNNRATAEDGGQDKKVYGVEAQINGVYLTHCNGKRLKISLSPERC